MAKIPRSPIEKSIGSAMAGVYQATVVIPPGRRVHHEKVRHTTPPDTREQIIRIYQDADPVGFLMDIVNGKMVEKHEVVEDPETGVLGIRTTYEQPKLTQRIKVATYLAEKYMPRLAVVNHRHMHTLDNGDKPGAGQRNFAQIVNEAARRVGSGEEDD